MKPSVGITLNTKMKTYQINGKIYAVIGEELYEKMPDWNELQVFVAATAGPEKPTRRKYGTGKVEKQSNGLSRRKMHCRVCDGYGHMAKTCPEKKQETEKLKAGKEEGLIESADPRSQVQEMKAAGKNSIEIARALRMSLAQVNKYW